MSNRLQIGGFWAFVHKHHEDRLATLVVPQIARFEDSFAEAEVLWGALSYEEKRSWKVKAKTVKKSKNFKKLDAYYRRFRNQHSTLGKNPPHDTFYTKNEAAHSIMSSVWNK